MITLTMRDGRKRVFTEPDPMELTVHEKGLVEIHALGEWLFSSPLDLIRSISMSTAKGSLVIYKRPNSKPKKEKRK